MTVDYGLHLVEVPDVLAHLRTWVRLARQNAALTQAELADKAGVPATSISRLERTGLASTDALARIFFALNELDALADMLANRNRQLSALLGGQTMRQRVRHSEEAK